MSDEIIDGRLSVLCHHPVWRSNGEQAILVGFTLLFCLLALNKLVNKLQERLEATKKATHLENNEIMALHLFQIIQSMLRDGWWRKVIGTIYVEPRTARHLPLQHLDHHIPPQQIHRAHCHIIQKLILQQALLLL